MKLQNMKRGETTEQIALFNWAMRSTHVLPCLSLMYHVPNEGKRTNGPVLKAMGMKNGVPDVCLPVASHNFHGLYLEMKYGNNKPTKAQEEYMAALQQQGYKTVVCYGAEEAKTEIMDYLQRICPSRNIVLKNEKPEFQHRCEHCVACIICCPQQAIQWKHATQKRVRYRNPGVSVHDIIEGMGSARDSFISKDRDI